MMVLFPTQSRCRIYRIFTLLDMMRFQTCEHTVGILFSFLFIFFIFNIIQSSTDDVDDDDDDDDESNRADCDGCHHQKGNIESTVSKS